MVSAQADPLDLSLAFDTVPYALPEPRSSVGFQTPHWPVLHGALGRLASLLGQPPDVGPPWPGARPLLSSFILSP